MFSLACASEPPCMDPSLRHARNPQPRHRAVRGVLTHSEASQLAQPPLGGSVQREETPVYRCAPGGQRVLLVCRCTLFRAGLSLLLQQFDPQLQVIQASDGCQALQWLRCWGPCDLALWVISLPAGCELCALRQLHLQGSTMPILALCASDASGQAAAALHLGAAACVADHCTPEELRRLVLRLLASAGEARCGTPPLQPVSPAAQKTPAGPVGAAATLSTCQALHITPRQADVLRLLCQGLSTKHICRALGLAQSTVKTHTHAVFHALQVSSRVQAVIAAGAWEWPTPSASSLRLRDRRAGSEQTGTGTRPAATAPRPGPGSATEVSYEHAA